MSTLYGHVDEIADSIEVIAERQYEPSVRHISEDDYNWLMAGAGALRDMLVYLRDMEGDQNEPDDVLLDAAYDRGIVDGHERGYGDGREADEAQRDVAYGKGYLAGFRKAERLERFAHAVARAVNEYETEREES